MSIESRAAASTSADYPPLLPDVRCGAALQTEVSDVFDSNAGQIWVQISCSSRVSKNVGSAS